MSPTPTVQQKKTSCRSALNENYGKKENAANKPHYKEIGEKMASHYKAVHTLYRIILSHSYTYNNKIMVRYNMQRHTTHLILLSP